MRNLIASVSLLCAASVIGAPPRSKPAWAWTLDERLAARFDEAARNQRIHELEAKQAAKEAEDIANHRRSRQTGPLPSRFTDVVQGSDYPELLMPFEILNAFTQAAYGAEDETARVVRQDASRKAIALGLPSTFLRDFEVAASTFIHQRQEEIRLRNGLYARSATNRDALRSRIRQLQRDECVSRTEAVKRLRSKFGEKFDQFLYSAIAPGVFRAIDEPITAHALRDQEEGCK